MKCISLLQPWASLVVLGHKKIETRSWNTSYRGPLLIHASAKFTKEQEALAHLFFQMVSDSRIYHCPRGAIIGNVNVKDTVSFDRVRHIIDKRQVLYSCFEFSEQELGFGDFSAGRFGWLLSNPIQFDNPIPAKGSLGLWEFLDIDQVIKKQLLANGASVYL